MENIFNRLSSVSNLGDAVNVLMDIINSDIKIKLDTSKSIAIKSNEGQSFCFNISSKGISMADSQNVADLTITADTNVLLDLIKGNLSPTKALLFKGLKINGDKSLLSIFKFK